MISLEEFQEAYADTHGGQEYEEPDPSQNVEETVVAQALVDQFKATLSEKDMQILELRMSGDTLEEIAEKLGYKITAACSSVSARSGRLMKPTPVWTTALRAAKSSDNTYRKSVGVIFMPKRRWIL